MAIGKPRIRIKSINNKWASIIYVSSSAHSRMLVEKLKEEIAAGNVDIVNPQLMPETEE